MNNDRKPQEENKEKDWEKLAGEYLDGWKRERAAFDNYRKEDVERFSQAHQRMMRNFLTALLPILDNFELAFTHTPEEVRKSEWFLGYTYIKKQFEDFLAQEGVKDIETKEKEFNPRLHEAIEIIEPEGEKAEGSLRIIEELRKGYILGDFVIRPARVRVKREGVEMGPLPDALS